VKFLALRDAFEALRLNEPIAQEVAPASGIPKHPDFARECRQRVVGGDILRTPIDKTAALVTSKAPWWAQPPPESKHEKISNKIPPNKASQVRQQNQKQSNHHVRKKGNKTMAGHNVKSITCDHPALPPEGQIMEEKSDAEINADLAGRIYKKADISVTEADRLVAKAMDARAALDVMCDHWKPSWIEFTQQSDERLKQFRMFRMAFDTESKLLMANLREVRQFFMDKDHDGEVNRLREFVDLCERLKKLKESGFLDTVADTMLKLA